MVTLYLYYASTMPVHGRYDVEGTIIIGRYYGLS